MMSPTLTLDIGGTHVSAALVGTNGLWPGSLVRLPVNEAWPAEQILKTWGRAALTATQASPVCQRIAVSMPGPFDYDQGIARFDQKMLALTNLDVNHHLRQQWANTLLEGLPLIFVNDAAAFTLGELRYGKGRGAGRLLGVTLGTGFGGGFVVDGQVLTGGLDVPPGGTIWQLPLRGGVAEDFISGAWLHRQYAQVTEERLEVQQLAARAQKGDPVARQLFTQFGQDIGDALITCVQRFRPERIIVGGQISRAWPLFFEPAQRALLPFKLARSDLLDRANLLGAASVIGPLTALSYPATPPFRSPTVRTQPPEAPPE